MASEGDSTTEEYILRIYFMARPQGGFLVGIRTSKIFQEDQRYENCLLQVLRICLYKLTSNKESFDASLRSVTTNISSASLRKGETFSVKSLQDSTVLTLQKSSE